MMRVLQTIIQIFLHPLMQYVTRSFAADFCLLEEFKPSCPSDYLILMKTSHYGRMRTGRCITRDYYIGCSADVTNELDDLCSGKAYCHVSVPDYDLLKLVSCPGDLVAYLQADYTCIKADSGRAEECSRDSRILISHPFILPHSSSTSITSAFTETSIDVVTGYISSEQAELNVVGGENCPYEISAEPGQKIRLSLIVLGGRGQTNNTSDSYGVSRRNTRHSFKNNFRRGAEKQNNVRLNVPFFKNPDDGITNAIENNIHENVNRTNQRVMNTNILSRTKRETKNRLEETKYIQKFEDRSSNKSKESGTFKYSLHYNASDSVELNRQPKSGIKSESIRQMHLQKLLSKQSENRAKVKFIETSNLTERNHFRKRSAEISEAREIALTKSAIERTEWCRHLYAVVREDIPDEGLTERQICSYSSRESHVYSSKTHSIRVVLNLFKGSAKNSNDLADQKLQLQNQQQPVKQQKSESFHEPLVQDFQHKFNQNRELPRINVDARPTRFIIKYEVIGCADAALPRNAEIFRHGNEASVSCHNNGKSYILTCRGNEWIGNSDNCSKQESGPAEVSQAGTVEYDKKKSDKITMWYAITIGVTVGVFIGFSLIVGLHSVRHRCRHVMTSHKHSCTARQQQACSRHEKNALLHCSTLHQHDVTDYVIPDVMKTHHVISGDLAASLELCSRPETNLGDSEMYTGSPRSIEQDHIDTIMMESTDTQTIMLTDLSEDYGSHSLKCARTPDCNELRPTSQRSCSACSRPLSFCSTSYRPVVRRQRSQENKNDSVTSAHHATLPRTENICNRHKQARYACAEQISTHHHHHNTHRPHLCEYHRQVHKNDETIRSISDASNEVAQENIANSVINVCMTCTDADIYRISNEISPT